MGLNKILQCEEEGAIDSHMEELGQDAQGGKLELGRFMESTMIRDPWREPWEHGTWALWAAPATRGTAGAAAGPR